MSDAVNQSPESGASPPPPPPPPPPGAPAASGGTITLPDVVRWLIVAAPVLIIIGSFLPWASLSAPFVGSITVNGMDGDGAITLVLGLGALGVAVPLFLGRAKGKGLAIAGIVLSALALAVALANISDVEGTVDSELEGLFTTSTGIGLWLIAAASVAALGGMIAAVRQRPAAA